MSTATSTIEGRSPAVALGGAGTERPKNKPVCQHCGAPLLDARMVQSGFCCAGCTYVFRLVHEHGLAGYYGLKDDVTTPADAAVFQIRDYEWLNGAQRKAEQVGQVSDLTPSERTEPLSQPKNGQVKDLTYSKIPELTLDVQGISCVGCVWLIERLFRQQPGARDIVVNAQYGTIRLRWTRGEFSAPDFARKLQAFGYLIGPAGTAVAEPESRALVKRIGLCAAFAMNVMLFAFPAYFGMDRTFEYARLFGLLALTFGTLSFLVGGTYFLNRALRALRAGALHIDLPIAIGIVGAYAGSLYGWLADEARFVYFDFVSGFILLMLIGRWAQVAAVERNQRQLLSQHPKPSRVRLVEGCDLPPEQVTAGHVMLLASGQTVPVESRLEADEAEFSLASINGEAEPRTFRLGQRIPAGAVSVSRSACRLVALQGWRESLLSQLLAPTERASERHLFLEKIVRGYLVGIIAVAIFGGVGWWWATREAVRTWAVVTAVLVVSCPCAIGLAFPLAEEMATVALRRRGVFVRSADLWTKLSRVKKLVFDKTGTLTLETPVLKNPEALAVLDAVARSTLLAMVRDNPHPIGQCLLENLLADAVPTTGSPIEPSDGRIIETVGHGLELGAWSLGRAGWRDNGPTGSGTVLARAGEVVAHFYFTETARPDARGELDALRKRGLAAFILSGDDAGKVSQLARELALPPDHAHGQLSPQDKANWIVAHAPHDAMMLGDGANDSLAFDRALCRGTPVIHRGVLEQKADFYYLGRGIGGLRALFAVDAIRRRTQVTILIFSVAYNLIAVGLAVAGRMNPLIAAILMPVNSLLTLLIVTGGMRRAFHS